MHSLLLKFSLELYARDCDGETVIYWEVQCPSPRFNRDVSFPKGHHHSPFYVFLCPMVITQWWYGYQGWITLLLMIAEASAKAVASCVVF